MVEISCLPRRRVQGEHPSGGAVGQEPAVDQPTWHRQCDGGSCVEIAVQGGAVMVRSSIAPEATLTLTRTEWQEFLAGAKQGLFDRV
jgi:hypothetical protein